MIQRRLAIPLFAAALLLLLPIGDAGATTFVMPTDAELFERSEVVLVGRVTAADAAPGTQPATDFSVQVDEVLKGFVPGTTVVLRELGGLSLDGSSRMVVLGGAPLAVGEEYVLFLEEHRGSTFRVVDLALGAFWRDPDSGLALRSLQGARQVSRADDPLAAERARSHLPRRFDDFVASLRQRARGETADADYFLDGPLVGIETGFNLFRSPEGLPPNGCSVNAGSPLRWREFDSAEPVILFANESGQPGVDGGGFNEIQQAIAAWSGVPGTRTNLTYGGTTPATSAIAGVDLLNSISFDDPDDEIPGSFPSDQSGTLAMAVLFFECEVIHPFLGGLAHTLVEAGIVTQDGVGSFFFDEVNFAEVLAHEIGHFFGIDHSCGDDDTGACSGVEAEAVMRAFVHDDGRGAALNADDRAALTALYPEPSGPGPAAPTDLVATPTSTSTVELTWSDNADDESGYSLEQRLPPGADFFPLADLPAGTQAATVTGLEPETAVEFKVRAYNDDAFSAYSNTASTTTFATPGPCIPDDQTLCLTEGRFQVTTTWKTDLGTSGEGRAEDITADTGYFWFFNEENIEMVVKVLDACVPELGNRFWVFAGGLTDVEVVLTVVDTETGSTRTYTNPLGSPFQPIQDTAAFETCS